MFSFTRGIIPSQQLELAQDAVGDQNVLGLAAMSTSIAHQLVVVPYEQYATYVDSHSVGLWQASVAAISMGYGASSLIPSTQAMSSHGFDTTGDSQLLSTPSLSLRNVRQRP